VTAQLSFAGQGLPKVVPQEGAQTSGVRVLRDYQAKAKREIYDFYRQGQRRILHIATGGLGKTTTATAIMIDRSIKAKAPGRSIFLVERDCLLRNTAETLRAQGVDCSVIQGQRKIDWAHPCFVASLQTLNSWQRQGRDLRQELGEVVLFVLDEAHDGVGQASYHALLECYPDAMFLGLTASPWRMDREEWLGRWFDCQVESMQPPAAIALGHLSPGRFFSVDGVFDPEGLPAVPRCEDYGDAALARQAMRPACLDLVVDEWRRLGQNRSTVAFCANVAHAKALCETFKASGIAAAAESGSTARSEREALDQALETGRIKVVCSVGTKTKGWDLPTLGCVLVVRATKSKALFYQIVWRGCRPTSVYPDFLCLDFGGNLAEHGDPMGLQDYYIGPPPPKPPTEVEAKICPNCGAENSPFAQSCDHCGHLFSIPDETESDTPALGKLSEWVGATNLPGLQALRARKLQLYELGQNPENAANEFCGKHGFHPPREWHRCAVFGKGKNAAERKANREVYEAYLQQFAVHKHWVRIMAELEFGAANEKIPEALQ
jgi:superfamily II DNA or RNA helicase